MGVLAQVAGGVGRGMVANVDDRREDASQEALRQQQQTLQRMRDTAAMERTNRSGEMDTEAYERQRKNALGDLQEKRDYDQSLVPGITAREDQVREDEQEHSVDIEAMKQWTKRTEAGTATTKDGKWEMKVLTQGEIGPNGLPVETDTFVVREPGTPFSYVQHGMTMLPHNYSDEDRDRVLQIAKNPDETQDSDTKILLERAGSGNDVSNDFVRVYGFLPAEYFRKIRGDSNGLAGFSEFRKSFREPANMPAAAPPPPPSGGVLEEAQQARNNAELPGAMNTPQTAPTAQMPQLSTPEDRDGPLMPPAPPLQTGNLRVDDMSANEVRSIAEWIAQNMQNPEQVAGY